VTSVSWPDAINYCATLTQRELAAARIPTGSQYRLPTEAEWECAARAGTSTRFSYGDDPDYASLPNHAWYASNSGLTAHPVGQKLPNPWGLYDMEGSPSGKFLTNFTRQTARSRRLETPISSMPSHGLRNHSQSTRTSSSTFPPLTDTDLGFRVVLVTEPQ
ncbi:MAG: hypothetical protein DMG09_20730, partial [Acidobacteria bacterium]